MASFNPHLRRSGDESSKLDVNGQAIDVSIHISAEAEMNQGDCRAFGKGLLVSIHISAEAEMNRGIVPIVSIDGWVSIHISAEAEMNLPDLGDTEIITKVSIHISAEAEMNPDHRELSRPHQHCFNPHLRRSGDESRACA